MQELNLTKECCKSLLVHRLILKLKMVVEMVRNKEVQTRTKRKRGKRWKEKSSSKKGQEIQGVFKKGQI